MSSTTTRTDTPDQIDDLAKAEQEAQQRLADAQAQVAAAQAKAQAAQDAANAARNERRREYDKQRAAAYPEDSRAAIARISAAKQAFSDAVIAGEPFGPAFLELVQAQADRHALERESAERQYAKGQAPLIDPQPPTPNLGSALTEALEREGHRRVREALEAVAENRRRYIEGETDDR